MICRNPAQADRDQAVRDQLVTQLEDAITGSDQLTADQRAKLAGRLQTKRGLKRLLRQTPGGLLGIDRSAIRAEQHLDGTFLPRRAPRPSAPRTSRSATSSYSRSSAAGAT